MGKERRLHLRFTKATAGALAAAALFSTLGMGTQNAAAAPKKFPLTQREGSSTNEITASQWEEIATTAEGAGDHESAQAAREAAEQANQESLGSIGRKAAKALLKYGRHLLPPSVRAWADKIYEIIDTIDVTGELAIAAFLIQNGIPADLALDIARWLMLFS